MQTAKTPGPTSSSLTATAPPVTSGSADPARSSKIPQTHTSATKHRKKLEKLVAKNQASAIKKSVIITYRKKSTGRIVRRRIDPLSVRGSVLGAWDHKRKAYRSFNFDRISHMEKSAFFEGFRKRASTLGHVGELAGLGMLAAPSVQALRGKDMSESAKHKLELAGLGTLAAPYVAQLGKKILTRGR